MYLKIAGCMTNGADLQSDAAEENAASDQGLPCFIWSACPIT